MAAVHRGGEGGRWAGPSRSSRASGARDANPWADHVVVTGIGHARNLAVAASGDAVIAVGGQLVYACGDRVRLPAPAAGGRARRPSGGDAPPRALHIRPRRSRPLSRGGLEQPHLLAVDLAQAPLQEARPLGCVVGEGERLGDTRRAASSWPAETPEEVGARRRQVAVALEPARCRRSAPAPPRRRRRGRPLAIVRSTGGTIGDGSSRSSAAYAATITSGARPRRAPGRNDGLEAGQRTGWSEGSPRDRGRAGPRRSTVLSLSHWPWSSEEHQLAVRGRSARRVARPGGGAARGSRAPPARRASGRRPASRAGTASAQSSRRTSTSPAVAA